MYEVWRLGTRDGTDQRAKGRAGREPLLSARMPVFGGQIIVPEKCYRRVDDIKSFIHPQSAMLTCHACMRRCLRTVIGDLPRISSSPSSSLTSNVSGGISYTRNYSSFSATEQHKVRVRTGSSDHGRRDGDSSKNSRQKWIESRGVRPASKKKPSFSTDEQLSQQLRYLKDPLKLADYVRKTLQRDDFETALKVVRASSKDIQCVVSWNHLVDWQLSKGHMKSAIKTYNEVFNLFLNTLTSD
jgi:hypothetical protein